MATTIGCVLVLLVVQASAMQLRSKLSPLPRLKEIRTGISVGTDGASVSSTGIPLPSAEDFARGGMAAALSIYSNLKGDLKKGISFTAEAKREFVLALAPLIVENFDSLHMGYGLLMITSSIIGHTDDETIAKFEEAIEGGSASSKVKASILRSLASARRDALARQPLVPGKAFHKRFPPETSTSESIFKDVDVTPSSVSSLATHCGVSYAVSSNDKPVILQPDDRSCGPTSVMMLLLSNSVPTSNVCPHVENHYGSTATYVSDLFNRPASAVGLVSRVIKFKSEPLDTAIERLATIIREHKGVIALLTGGGAHFVVVDEASAEGVRIRDPWHGWEVTVKTLAFFDRLGVEPSLVVVSDLPPSSSAPKATTPPSSNLCISVQKLHSIAVKESKDSGSCQDATEETCDVAKGCCWRRAGICVAFEKGSKH